MDFLISIIIPVYNAEKFLEHCINSVLAQTYSYWELILVDDGSADKSSVICDNFAVSDSRIHVFHKANTGVSDTRNFALDQVSGDYVIFLDADDFWCDNNILEKMINYAVSDDLDIVRGEYIAVDEHGLYVFERSVSKEQRLYAGKILDSYEFLKYAVGNDFYLVLSLFKADIIRDIRFEKGRVFLEDMQFFSNILVKQNLKCMFLPEEKFYIYRKNSDSISFKINPQKLKDAFDLCYFFHDLSLKAENKNILYFFQEKSLRIYFTTLETIAEKGYYKDRHKYIYDLELIDLWRNIQKWIDDYNMTKYSIIYYIPPIYSVNLFRIKYIYSEFKEAMYRLKCNMMSKK